MEKVKQKYVDNKNKNMSDKDREGKKNVWKTPNFSKYIKRKQAPFFQKFWIFEGI